jgi:hypothetical protein
MDTKRKELHDFRLKATSLDEFFQMVVDYMKEYEYYLTIKSNTLYPRTNLCATHSAPTGKPASGNSTRHCYAGWGYRIEFDMIDLLSGKNVKDECRRIFCNGSFYKDKLRIPYIIKGLYTDSGIGYSWSGSIWLDDFPEIKKRVNIIREQKILGGFLRSTTRNKFIKAPPTKHCKTLLIEQKRIDKQINKLKKQYDKLEKQIQNARELQNRIIHNETIQKYPNVHEFVSTYENEPDLNFNLDFASEKEKIRTTKLLVRKHESKTQ